MICAHYWLVLIVRRLDKQIQEVEANLRTIVNNINEKLEELHFETEGELEE